MEAEEALKIARAYALGQGFDTVRLSGSRDGFIYFHMYNEATCGHKLGLPLYLKIDGEGHVSYVEDFHETMWAINQEIKLNGLGNSL